jgi:hypothetical protein
LAKAGFIILIVAAMIGGNLIVLRSMKRRGIPYSTAFFPTPSGFKAVYGLNGWEWAGILLLVFPSFLIGAHGFFNATQ